MEYDVFMTARQNHEEHVGRLAQSYADAQADTKSLKRLLSNGAGWLNSLFRGNEAQDWQHTSGRRPEFAPVILDDRRGDSW